MAADGNMKNATQTYESFVGFVKWGTITCVILAAIVVLAISS